MVRCNGPTPGSGPEVLPVMSTKAWQGSPEQEQVLVTEHIFQFWVVKMPLQLQYKREAWRKSRAQSPKIPKGARELVMLTNPSPNDSNIGGWRTYHDWDPLPEHQAWPRSWAPNRTLQSGLSTTPPDKLCVPWVKRPQFLGPSSGMNHRKTTVHCPLSTEANDSILAAAFL